MHCSGRSVRSFGARYCSRRSTPSPVRPPPRSRAPCCARRSPPAAPPVALWSPKADLGTAFIEPALQMLATKASSRVSARGCATSLSTASAHATTLRRRGGELEDKATRIVLATPPWIAHGASPRSRRARRFSRASSMRISRSRRRRASRLCSAWSASLTEWLFAFDDRLSVTISGADRLMDEPRETLAEQIWAEVSAATGLASDVAALADRQGEARDLRRDAARRRSAVRPRRRTSWHNLLLAGDWTTTGLPATIEGSIRSGYRAAEFVLGKTK